MICLSLLYFALLGLKFEFQFFISSLFVFDQLLYLCKSIFLLSLLCCLEFCDLLLLLGVQFEKTRPEVVAHECLNLLNEGFELAAVGARGLAGFGVDSG